MESVRKVVLLGLARLTDQDFVAQVDAVELAAQLRLDHLIVAEELAALESAGLIEWLMVTGPERTAPGFRLAVADTFPGSQFVRAVEIGQSRRTAS